jgi:hypothetical protein
MMDESTAKRGQTAEIAERRREKEENSLGESLRSPRSLRLKRLFAVESWIGLEKVGSFAG